MDKDDINAENIIDQPDRAIEGNPTTMITHFSFLHPPGNDMEVNGLHYTIDADGNPVQVYIVRGDQVQLVQGGMAQASENSMALASSGENFGALVDQQHAQLADVQDHLVRAAEAMMDSFSISQSFLKS